MPPGLAQPLAAIPKEALGAVRGGAPPALRSASEALSAWFYLANARKSRAQELYLPDLERAEGPPAWEQAVLGAQKSLKISGQTLAYWDVGPREAEGSTEAKKPQHVVNPVLFIVFHGFSLVF